MVIAAPLLVFSVFGEENWAEVYFGVNIKFKCTHEILVNWIEIDQAVNHMKSKQFYSAVNILKGFKKKESEVRDIPTTNIYFLYCLEIIFNLAEDYAGISVNTSKYNSKVPVNKGI